jgi:hypothetical protein
MTPQSGVPPIVRRFHAERGAEEPHSTSRTGWTPCRSLSRSRVLSTSTPISPLMCSARTGDPCRRTPCIQRRRLRRLDSAVYIHLTPRHFDVAQDVHRTSCTTGGPTTTSVTSASVAATTCTRSPGAWASNPSGFSDPQVAWCPHRAARAGAGRRTADREPSPSPRARCRAAAGAAARCSPSARSAPAPERPSARRR